MSPEFGTITLTRQLNCEPDQLFGLLSSPEARSVWGTPSETAVFDILESDIRPGGHELARCGPSEHPEFLARTDFHIVEAPSRMICTETVFVEEAAISVSLVTLDVIGRDTACDLTMTAQIASLRGSDMVTGYNDGWGAALNKLVELSRQTTAAQ
ncbi:SRPBCC domain-containing protein [Actibacterium sp. 188UL27-1]|uniref:SRPBCC domain-containing protein n=1 Tax=Actibacterium sp. 188UL27-1 TaxID=2786961 RepID=UPI00195710A8|nr:SRPBCC domain-containing protein [Actibacterium sp. 188UL27-1]MBM7066638.1 SRPBCC domain-containing protein [Actibacterium sp. 188UL27-1]